MSRKVRLMFQRPNVDFPSIKDVFSRSVEIEEAPGFDDFKLVSARVYQVKGNKEVIGGDITTAIVDYKDDQRLIGQLLTYVDATFSDPEQRKAHKDIVRQIVARWVQDIRNGAVKDIDYQEKLSQEAQPVSN